MRSVFILFILINSLFCDEISLEEAQKRKNKVLEALAEATLEPSRFKKQEEQVAHVLEDGLKQGNTYILAELIKGVEDDTKKMNLQTSFKQMEEDILKKMRSEVQKKLNLYEISKQASMELYGKKFTGKEIVELLKFYQSDLGKKALSLSESMFQETQELVSRRVDPVVKELTESMRTEMQSQVNDLILKEN